ncbi:PREDICTED: cell cycle checkpoint protein RAD17-like [Priapulus caudatus]|uniref:Cell cycle checkpoint protein RAD17-like n=1 Tax=Priapulus caudatus TaxID=37621 RepID=A0ABM1ED71_PRICU|nr:PREDICTED: cell cycle checkpoint protein RAD17-like [Priapulus caudatus]
MKSSLWCDDEDDVRSNSALGKKCKDSFPLVKSIDAFPKARDASSKKAQGWVSPSFGDFRTDAQSSVSRKRSRDGNRKTDHKSITVGRRDVDDTMLWSDKYKPTNKDDLAVHKKKVAEVEDWLLQQFGHASRKGAGILLLAGPAGAGKSTSVRLLASELRMEVQEWINPPTSTYRPEWTPHSSDFTEYGESQATQFREFLLRANKYPALQMLGSVASERKIVLVEDFPNAFFRDSSNFHRILSKYGSTAQSPLVFIVSDSQGGESNVQKLFPRNAQADLGIHCISFNPVAATSMLKVLARVAAEEAAQGRHDFPAPSADVMSALADGSSGDLRGALNALQFACLRDTCDLAGGAGDGSGRRTEPSRRAAKSRTAGRRRRKEAVRAVGGGEEEAEAGGSIGCRDTTLFLFRALGKVLYCKREPPDGDTEQEVLPPHLAHHARRRLQCVPEV